MQWSIEMILMKQLAVHLTTPILVVDPRGDLVFYNEAAERIIGKRFDEVGTIRREDWMAVFQPQDDEGSIIAPENRPLTRAVDQNESSQLRFWILGLDGVRREVEGIAFPMFGQSGRKLGAVGIFWQTEAR
jgi:PAS domain-containing protein